MLQSTIMKLWIFFCFIVTVSSHIKQKHHLKQGSKRNLLLKNTTNEYGDRKYLSHENSSFSSYSLNDNEEHQIEHIHFHHMNKGNNSADLFPEKSSNDEVDGHTASHYFTRQQVVEEDPEEEDDDDEKAEMVESAEKVEKVRI